MWRRPWCGRGRDAARLPFEFKDWARHAGVDEPLSEYALAHVEGSRTVAAYARDDLLEKRRSAMQAWCESVSAVGCRAGVDMD
ncbi:MAG: hypothetical protein OXH15_20830 [Gammaproteobacteria bacterium]|nr:hypothetical protein [Gammaproteobacteria bacterium]